MSRELKVGTVLRFENPGRTGTGLVQLVFGVITGKNNNHALWVVPNAAESWAANAYDANGCEYYASVSEDVVGMTVVDDEDEIAALRAGFPEVFEKLGF